MPSSKIIFAAFMMMKQRVNTVFKIQLCVSLTIIINMQSSDALDTLKCAIWAFTFKILIFQWIIFNVYIYNLTG